MEENNKLSWAKLFWQILRQRSDKSMISKVGQIMLYVNNQDEAVNFWTEKAGFSVISEENNW